MNNGRYGILLGFDRAPTARPAESRGHDVTRPISLGRGDVFHPSRSLGVS